MDCLLGYVLNVSTTVRYSCYVISLVPLLNEVQLLLPGGLLLGLYSGIFAMYLKCQSNNSSKPTILFYALCLLYVLSTFSIVSDLVFVTLQLEVSNNSI